MFILIRYVAHRHLHSFPTRRSSDLFPDLRRSPVRPDSIERPLWRTVATLYATTKTSAAYNVRSEEHTSELQSHSDLVCRLLLEKKKHRDTKNIKTEEKLVN